MAQKGFTVAKKGLWPKGVTVGQRGCGQKGLLWPKRGYWAKRCYGGPKGSLRPKRVTGPRGYFGKRVTRIKNVGTKLQEATEAPKGSVTIGVIYQKSIFAKGKYHRRELFGQKVVLPKRVNVATTTIWLIAFEVVA